MNDYRPQNFSILPVVVKNILIINGLFFLATFTLDNVFRIDLADYLGLHMPLSEKFKPYQLLTYMFMHGGFWHIFSNMLAVWMFGSALENYWGPKRFLTYYILTGFGAALIHYGIVYYQMLPTLNAADNFLMNPSKTGLVDFINSSNFKMTSVEMQDNFQKFLAIYNTPENLIGSNTDGSLAKAVEYIHLYKQDYLNSPVIVGASGALFGLLLAFGMLFPNILIYVYFAIPIKAKYFVMIYGALELYSGINNSTGDNIAHFAHLGGMVFGFILIKYWGKKSSSRF